MHYLAQRKNEMKKKTENTTNDVITKKNSKKIFSFYQRQIEVTEESEKVMPFFFDTSKHDICVLLSQGVQFLCRPQILKISMYYYFRAANCRPRNPMKISSSFFSHHSRREVSHIRCVASKYEISLTLFVLNLHVITRIFQTVPLSKSARCLTATTE